MFSDILLELQKRDGGGACGYVTSVEEALQVVRLYETETLSRFVCIKRPANFGKKVWSSKANTPLIIPLTTV